VLTGVVFLVDANYFHFKCAALVSMVSSVSDGSLDQKTSTEEVEKSFRVFFAALSMSNWVFGTDSNISVR
jgi:hypothetical protein